MKTKVVMATATDGTKVALRVPTTLPTQDRGDYLRGLFGKHVVELDGHWKGRVEATVPAELSGDMREAMEFMGALIDDFEIEAGEAWLFSEGYWAHGF